MPMSPDPPAPPAVAEDEEGMPSPSSPAPPSVAEEDEERPWPAMKMKLFPYAMFCVFGGIGRYGDSLLIAYVVIHYLLMIARLLAFHTDGGQARFWTLVSRVLSSLCFAATTLIMAVFIRYYMRVDGEYHVEFDPPSQKQPAPPAAEEQLQLPPPPPEMDMC